jgi:phosphoenolpyruvate carboxykinase (ATP)
MWQWWKAIISGEVPLEINAPVCRLVEKALQDGSGQLGQSGALCITTDDSIGDLYVVTDECFEMGIDWGQGHLKIDDSDFQEIKNAFLKEINFLKPQAYIMERSLGPHDQMSVGLRFITTLPSHALFVRHLFAEASILPHPEFLTIFHSSQEISDWEEAGRIPKRVIALHLGKREVIIAGSSSLEDIRSAILTFMSLISIEKNVLPLHAQATLNQLGHGYLFFDDSINTKFDEEPIFEDQLVLTDQGAYSLIPGKYWQDDRIKRYIPFFGTICNNIELNQKDRSVVVGPTDVLRNRGVVFPSPEREDGSFLIKAIDKIFIFIDDDYGVLPLISKLTSQQAHFFFMNGYMGNNTFKSCCGDPYRLGFLRHYGRLFLHFLEYHHTSVWLVNKGYYGGKANHGTRYPWELIRQCVRQIMQTDDHINFLKLPLFELSIPMDLSGVERRYLNPMFLWENQADYLMSAAQFEKMMRQNFDCLGLAEEVLPSPQIGELNI